MVSLFHFNLLTKIGKGLQLTFLVCNTYGERCTPLLSSYITPFMGSILV